MYAIACKFPDQKRFKTLNIQTGEQVGKWVYCTLFNTRDRAEEIMQQVKAILIPGVEIKIIKYYK